MQLNKWDGAPDSTKTTLLGGGSSSSSGGGESGGSRGGGDISRTIWGQNDIGDDIDGSATIHGDVHIKSITPPTYEPDDEWDDGEFEDEEEGGGSLDVELDVTVGRHLYINHPHPDHQGEKKCVGELINALDGRITTNATNITNLTTKVNTNATNIQTNADEIAKLQTTTLTKKDVLKLIAENQPSMDGDIYHPIVLASGVARRVSYYKDKYYIGDMRCNPHISLSNTIEGGLMTIEIQAEDGYTVRANAVHATQQMSGDTGSDIVSTINGRNDGAHWFECRVDNVYNTTKAYIREFHQKDGNNDSWGADTWFGDGGVSAVNISIIGYVLPTP